MVGSENALCEKPVEIACKTGRADFSMSEEARGSPVTSERAACMCNKRTWLHSVFLKKLFMEMKTRSLIERLITKEQSKQAVYHKNKKGKKQRKFNCEAINTHR